MTHTFDKPSQGPLAGFVVPDLTRVLAGPFCTMMLGDLGAIVIKVEQPGPGDEARHFLPFIGGESAYFTAVNRGKKSIALDLKVDADRAVFDELLAKADVLVEKFPPGVLDKLGYAFDLIERRHPRLVLATISGFGQSGPYKDKGAYDIVVQAIGGMMSITGHPGMPPARPGSEPGAGSDLAAVRTEAVLEGDEFIVNGQKTWTTWGSDGTHMFMLVRTDKTVKKQAGISFLLVDLKTPGVTVRPIRNIAAEQEFCEVFFDNVRVPKNNLVGELNQGWTVAKALLGFERLFTGSPKHSQYTLGQVEKLARQCGLFDDAAFVARFAELQLDTADLRAAYTGFAEMAKRGEPIPPSISMLKIWSTETSERLALLLIESAQEYGGLRDHCRNDEIDLHVVAPLFNAIGAKIFAGSNEIQRNILAKQVLDLPS